MVSFVYEQGSEVDTTEDTRLKPHITPMMAATNYQPDQAIREASLTRKELWRLKDGEMFYLTSNKLEVCLRTPVDERSQACKQIHQINESTALTARILLGLWSVRRHNSTVSEDGSVTILLKEILQWQGIQKHSRIAHTGVTRRYTDGYRPEQKQRVIRDIALLASCTVRGTCNIVADGKTFSTRIDDPYLRYSVTSRKTDTGKEVVTGFLVALGNWITTYEQHKNAAFTQVDKRIFTLNPQNERYALRLALYLTERWREQATQGTFGTPITMSELLRASMIEVDERHLTSRFIPKIEKALLQLEQMEIIGKQQRLSTFDVTRTRWGREWLTANWEILPPLELMHVY